MTLNTSPDTPQIPELTIDLGGTPCGAIPAGCCFVGTICRHGASVGALLLIVATGLYVQLSGSSFIWLDQQAVSQALVAGKTPNQVKELDDELQKHPEEERGFTL